jgi:hypothetical protein
VLLARPLLDLHPLGRPVRFLAWVVGLILFGHLLAWVATSWPDTLSGLFMLALIGLFTALCFRAITRSGYRYGGYTRRVRVDHYHHRDPNR